MADMSKFDITPELSRTETKTEKLSTNSNVEGKWGLPLSGVYKLGLKFYKEKQGIALQLSYEDKLQLVAFAQQVSHGPYDAEKVPPVGALDVVGRDRHLAWQRLGDLSADQARSGFVSLLTRRCPHFEAFIEAHRRENEEKLKKAQEDAMRELEKRKQREEEEKIEKEIRAKQEVDELSRRKVQQALNEQTYEQFRTYSEQQFPGDPERQGDLVKQLQDQHYLQYMQQLQASSMHLNNTSKLDESGTTVTEFQSSPVESTNILEEEERYSDDILPASMWTQANISEFKETVLKSEGDGVVRVGHGETVTVRVPTTKLASQLFWEFATDHYDIGFGVYFEWGTPMTDQVLVHISESEEDDDEEEDYDTDYMENVTEDIEIGGNQRGAVESIRSSRFNKQQPILTEIVPIYRRDSHMEVYVGSHTYPGEGCYILKFDNSYSLWRSKTLYYRICYSN